MIVHNFDYPMRWSMAEKSLSLGPRPTSGATNGPPTGRNSPPPPGRSPPPPHRRRGARKPSPQSRSQQSRGGWDGPGAWSRGGCRPSRDRRSRRPRRRKCDSWTPPDRFPEDDKSEEIWSVKSIRTDTGKRVSRKKNGKFICIVILCHKF